MPSASSARTSRRSSRSEYRRTDGKNAGPPAGRPAHRRDDDDDVQPLAAQDGGVGRRVHAAVEVAVPADLHRGEVPGHGAGRPDGEVDRRLGRTRPAEDDPPPVAPPHRADPEVRLGPLRAARAPAAPPAARGCRAVPGPAASCPRPSAGTAAAGSAPGRACAGPAAASAGAAAPAGGRAPARAASSRRSAAGRRPRRTAAPSPSRRPGPPAETPSRSSVPVIDPAEVPTIMSAVRASKPKSFCSTASTPEWYACPTTPPPPSTRPTRVTDRACHGRRAAAGRWATSRPGSPAATA